MVGRPPDAQRPLGPQIERRVDLLRRIADKQARIGVIGLGYVGLPLAVEFAKAGFHVIGFDVDAAKVDGAQRRHELHPRRPDRRRRRRASPPARCAPPPTSADLADVDAIDICVPTPLRKTKDPDLSYVVAGGRRSRPRCCAGPAGHPRVDDLSRAPPTKCVQPMLEAGGLEAGDDFFLAFSPERVDPGNPTFHTRNIPKVVGGVNDASTAASPHALYGSIIDTVVPVSSTRVAEMVKLLENTFRAVNIGLVNELALMCDRMDIDVWEVIDAAKTKPFGFMPFYPGPGPRRALHPDRSVLPVVEGAAERLRGRFIELAGQVNGSMPDYVVERVADALNTARKAVNGSRVHVARRGLQARRRRHARVAGARRPRAAASGAGATVSYTDPFVPVLHHGPVDLTSVTLDEALAAGCDCAVIVTDHTAFDYPAIAGALPARRRHPQRAEGPAHAHRFPL